MISTRKRPEGGAPSALRERTVRSPAPSGERTVPGDDTVAAILAEFRRRGIPAMDAARRGYPPSPLGRRGPEPPRPIIVGGRDGADAIVVVLHPALVAYLFGTLAGGRLHPRALLRSVRRAVVRNRLYDSVTDTAIALGARRLLIVCDTARADRPERIRAIRWVREVAHRIGYECSINGVHNLTTSYLVLVAELGPGEVTRAVVDWYRRRTRGNGPVVMPVSR